MAEVLQVNRSASIADPTFAARLAAGQAEAREGDANNELEMEEDDRLEDIRADFPNRGELQPAPEMTQAVGDDEDDTNNDEEVAKEALKQNFPTLNGMTFRQKELWAKKHHLLMKAGKDPYTLTVEMREAIERSEGDDKQESIEMFNAIYAVFQSARGNAHLRNFIADLFHSQREYYQSKEEKRSIDLELRQMGELYDETEYEQAMQILKDKQAQRKLTLELKGVAQAERQAASVNLKKAERAATADPEASNKKTRKA